jgi:hypothetical protein
MTPEENPMRLFSGTENLRSPATPPPTPTCPTCGQVLDRPPGWKASVNLPPIFETDALRCPKCQIDYVDLDMPVPATTTWLPTNQG